MSVSTGFKLGIMPQGIIWEKQKIVNDMEFFVIEDERLRREIFNVVLSGKVVKMSGDIEKESKLLQTTVYSSRTKKYRSYHSFWI